jgi:hypothetical protein
VFFSAFKGLVDVPLADRRAAGLGGERFAQSGSQRSRFHRPGAMGNGSMLTAGHQNAERGTFLTIAAFRSGGLPCFDLLVWICLEE